MKKIGRNDPCRCGSGKKFKKCCDGMVRNFSNLPNSVQGGLDSEIKHRSELHEANEFIRKKQQGLGKPIIQQKVNCYQIVIVGSNMHSSKTWKVFSDFLSHYMIEILTKEWIKSERLKPIDQQNPIIEWQDKCHEYHKKFAKGNGEVISIPLNGAVLCYLGLAYSIYLLEHNLGSNNSEVKKLVDGLKDKKQFQGAYYEAIIMNCFIRAGFEITLIEQTSEGPKRCDFDAISKKTGEKYSIEVRMKGISGLLGKDDSDGAPKDSYLLTPLKNMFKDALEKSASGKRIVFLGLNYNAPQNLDQISILL